MESNRHSIENHQTMVWNTSSDEQEIGEVRIYKCTFCERGFSNAQALGGHMNIHRKDRARLKEFPELDIVSSTTTSRENQHTSSALHLPRDDHNSIHQLIPSPDQYQNFMQQGRNCTHKRPLRFLEEEDADQEDSRRLTDGFKDVAQLPLFVDKQSSTRNQLKGKILVHEDVETMKIQRSPRLKLDLELRLGPEPHEEHQPCNIEASS